MDSQNVLWGRVSDLVWYWADPDLDPSSQDKLDLDPYPDPTPQDKPDPDLDPDPWFIQDWIQIQEKNWIWIPYPDTSVLKPYPDPDPEKQDPDQNPERFENQIRIQIQAKTPDSDPKPCLGVDG